MKFRRITSIITGLSAIVAGGLGGIAHWNKHQPTSDELLPQRHIASVHIHNLPAEEAVAQLEQLVGVPIIVDWKPVWSGPDLYPRIWLDFDDITISDLLHVLLGQLHTKEDMDFAVENNAIVLARSSRLPQFVRVYDVADLRSDAPFAQQPGGGFPDEITGGTELLASNFADGFNSGPQPWIWGSATHVSALQTAAGHQRIEQLLAAVRRSRPDGSGPEIPHEAMWHPSQSTIVRFYDVRDLVDRLDYTSSSRRDDYEVTPVFTRRETIYTLARAATSKVDAGAWYTDPIWSIAGRLVIDQTPEVHALIRHALAEIRAGKTVNGYHLRRPVGMETKANAITPQMNTDEHR